MILGSQVAFVGFVGAALVCRQGPIEALQSHLSDPFSNNIIGSIARCAPASLHNKQSFFRQREVQACKRSERARRCHQDPTYSMHALGFCVNVMGFTVMSFSLSSHRLPETVGAKYPTAA